MSDFSEDLADGIERRVTHKVLERLAKGQQGLKIRINFRKDRFGTVLISLEQLVTGKELADLIETGAVV